MTGKNIASKITIKEVAKLAGVSTATVSRVISNSGNVRENLRTRVLETIDSLGYFPNQLGRSLRRQTTNLVGLVITDIQNPFFTSVLRGIQDVLQVHKQVVLVTNSDENPEQEKIHLQVLRAQGVRGIIFVPTISDYKDFQDLFEGIPVIAIDRKPKNLSVDTVTVDNVEGMKLATQHLIAARHRRIGFISGLLSVSTGQERLQGYLEAIQESGLPIEQELIQNGFFHQPGGYEAMSRLLDLADPPTAVVSSNNLMTLGALQAIHDRCLKIPDEIAIVGFDDMDWAASLQPPLTVVAQPSYEIGRTAANFLLERFDNPDLPKQNIVLKTSLVVRASTRFNPCL